MPAGPLRPDRATSTLLHLVALDLVERDVTIGGVLAGHPEHPFTDDVASHLGAAAPEAASLPGEELIRVLADHRALRPGDRGRARDLDVDVRLADRLLPAEEPQD